MRRIVFLVWVGASLVACGGGRGSDAEGGNPPPDAGPPLTCGAVQGKLSVNAGTEQSYSLKGWPRLWGAGPNASRFSSKLGSGVYDVSFEGELDATQSTLPSVIPAGRAWPVRSALFAEATKNTLGPIRCVAPGSGSTLERVGEQLSFDLKQVDVIAACRDRPIDGQINVCLAPNGCGDPFDGGSVGGAPWTVMSNSYAGVFGSWQADLQDGSSLRAETDINGGGALYWALIVSPPTSAGPGRVLCATGGTEESVSDYATVLHLTGLGAIDCQLGSNVARACLNGTPAPTP